MDPDTEFEIIHALWAAMAIILTGLAAYAQVVVMRLRIAELTRRVPVAQETLHEAD